MITTLAFLAAFTVSSADETAILRQVLDKYFVETARRGPDARKSLFIAETMADGEIDRITLVVPPSSPEQVDELVESLRENNREPIALPELKEDAILGDASELRVGGEYDWEKIALSTGGVESVVEVSRPAFTRNGKVAVVRLVVRQPKESYQIYYLLERAGETWRLRSSVRGRTKP